MAKNTILIVDDEPANLEVLLDCLPASGSGILAAENGESALEQAARDKPDIILLDVKMPGMDGFEVCRRLKKEKATQDIPIIFMSAAADTVDKVYGFKLGAVDFISKPFQVQEVLARVKSHLSIHNLQKKLGEKNLRMEQEIAGRKEVEEKLRESEGRWQSLAKNTPAFITIINRDHEIQYINHPVPGLSVADVVGKSVYDFIEPKYHSLAGESFEKVLNTGETGLYTSEARGANGSTAWYENHLGPILLKGEIAGVTIIATDVSQRKESEQALKKSELTLKKSQEIAHTGSWYLDIEKNELHWSDEVYRIFGLKPQEFGATYEAFIQAIHPDDRDMVDETYAKAIKNNTPYEIVHRVLRPDGEVRFVHEKSEDIADESGKTIYSTGIVQDISERVRAEEQIKAALQEKEVLLKEIHHRVKNNFTTISSLLSLQSRYIKNEHARQVFKNSQDRIKTMALIHEKLYKSENLSRIDFCDYLRSLTSHIFNSYPLQQEQVRLKIDVKKDLYLDIKTSIPVSLIINELVSNSIKYAFPKNKKGEVRIVLRDCDEKKYDFTLIVADNGVGFPEDIDFRNSGSFGLLIIIALIKQLRGVINLDRTGGTTFTIKFKTPTYIE